MEGHGEPGTCDTPRKLPRLVIPRVRARGQLGKHGWEFPKYGLRLNPAGSRRRVNSQDKPKETHGKHLTINTVRSPFFLNRPMG